MPAISYISSTLLQAYHGVRHTFFTRQGGVSEGLYASLNGGLGSNDDPAAVRTNRERMAAVLDVQPEHFLSLYQFHSPDVVTVDEPWSVNNRPHADAMVTRRTDLALAIATADCGPVLLADPQAGVIGAAHAGWKGALGGVLEATLSAMESLGAKRSDINVALGPTLSMNSYEVGPEFKAKFLAEDTSYAAFFHVPEREYSQSGRVHFDLPAFIRFRLERAGIVHFEDIGLCTYTDEKRFFSYRRSVHRNETDYGRLISAISLTK